MTSPEVRTTIVLPEDLLERLRRFAAQRGSSMSAVIREALEEKIGRERPKPRSLGIAASGTSDTSVRAGEEPAVPRTWR